MTNPAAKRGRRPKSEYHPTPGLLIALEHFKSQGMKSGSQVVFRNEQAVFDALGARHIKPLPGHDWGCETDGAKLLAAISGMKESASFVFADNALTCMSEGNRTVIPAAPAENMIAQPVFMGACQADALQAFADAGDFAKTFGVRVVLLQGALWCVASGAFVRIQLSTQFANVPGRALYAEPCTRLSKIKAPLVGMGYSNPSNFGLFFGDGPQAANASVVLFTNSDIDEKVQRAAANLDRLKPEGEPSELSPSFFAVLKELSQFADNDLVQFDGLGTMYVGSTMRNCPISMPACAFSIECLLSARPFAERHVIVVQDDMVQFWFDRNFGGALGCVVSIKVGNVDGAQVAGV